MSTVAIVPTVTGTPASTIGGPPLSVPIEEPPLELLLLEPLPPEVLPPGLPPLEMPLLEGPTPLEPLALLLEAPLEPPPVPLSSEPPANPPPSVDGLEQARTEVASEPAAINVRTVFIGTLEGSFAAWWTR
jgi:hypothetical protein